MNFQFLIYYLLKKEYLLYKFKCQHLINFQYQNAEITRRDVVNVLQIYKGLQHKMEPYGKLLLILKA